MVGLMNSFWLILFCNRLIVRPRIWALCSAPRHWYGGVCLNAAAYNQEPLNLWCLWRIDKPRWVLFWSVQGFYCDSLQRRCKFISHVVTVFSILRSLSDSIAALHVCLGVCWAYVYAFGICAVNISPHSVSTFAAMLFLRMTFWVRKNGGCMAKRKVLSSDHWATEKKWLLCC